jgi:hypothetical protein
VRIPAAHRKLEILQLYFFQVCKSKMAAARGATHGGKRRNSGRKRKYERSNSAQLVWNRQHKQIYLSLTIFKSWKDAKTVRF